MFPAVWAWVGVGAGFARNWLFPESIVDALRHQCAPFENEVYQPLARILGLAVWRARAKKSEFESKDFIDSFPYVVGLALGQDSTDWTSRAEVKMLA